VRGLLGELISERHQLTVADMEAGLEHLSRSDGTLRHIDLLLVVLEPYRKALETGRRTYALASQLGIGRIAAVASKVRDETERREVEAYADSLGMPVLGVIPYDEAVRTADREGVALIERFPDSASVHAVTDLLSAVERTWATV
jgi:CO dehydrogenase maturation factor